MEDRIDSHGLKIARPLWDFIETQALPGTGVSSDAFWAGLSRLAHDFGPKNRALLAKREEIQTQIDDWHKARKGKPHDAAAYEAFLHEIGYLVPEGPDFDIDTAGVDPEIAMTPGAQLVVPIMNARFALNAANARWGNLYDAFYGTDALGDLPSGKGYDPERGARVIARAKAFLDEAVPLQNGSWADVTDVSLMALQRPQQYLGTMTEGDWTGYLFENNGLKIEILTNATHDIGKDDPAHIAAVNLEAALSTIMDCEDSVAAVDAEDKVLAYSNWLGLMKGDLSETFEKGGKTVTRKLFGDATYIAPDGADFTVKCRSVMLVRNVGHLMTNPAILDRDGAEIGEGLMDALCTVMIAMHDLAKAGGPRNSETGSVYIVKPKMHGPEEVAFSNEIFGAVEEILGLPANTVKMGIMDEERRTSANLKECIRAARSRVAFINT
ncbi:MAG: malate synthase G, partial [Pseudomonadota bacterium]